MLGLCLTAAAALVIGADGFLAPALPVRATAVQRQFPLSMSIAVFGSTGLLGSEVTYQALQRGEDVIALVRDPAKLKIPQGSGGDKAGQPLHDSKITVIQGTSTNQADVDRVFASGDVTGVVIALGGKTKDVGKTMLTDSTTAIIKAMKANDVKRVAVVTSIGAGDSKDQAPFAFKMLMFTVMKSIFEDKNNQERLFSQGPGADLEYVIVRPGGLTVDKPTGVVNVIDGQAGSIPRADVATFCLGAVTESGFPYIRKTPCISSTGGTSWSKDRSAAARGGM